MQKTNHNSLKRFLKYTYPYKWLLLLGISCGMTRYLIPLVMPWTLKVLVDDFFVPGKESLTELHWVMFSLLSLYVLYVVVSYCRSYFSGVAGHKMIFDLRQDLYRHVQQMGLSFFERQKIGAVVAKMTNDIAAAQNFVGSALINTAMDLACISAIIIMLFMYHWKLALMSLSILPFYSLVHYSLTKRIKKKSRDIHDQLQEISGDLHEQFAGISTIQAFTQEESEASEFKKQSEKYLDTVLSNVHLQSIALAATSFLTGIGPILVLWYGAMEVWNGRLSLGTLMAFNAYLAMLYQPIQRLTDLNLILVNSLAAMDRIFEVFDTYPEIRESRNAIKFGRVHGNIHFERISFAYEGRESAISDISLAVPAGMTLALVGPSGAGKSTLAKLLPRFYDVTSGRITIDQTDIRDVTLKSLRQQIAIVSQEPIFFSGTLKENLRYGKPEATDKEITQAAEDAFAAEFIKRLPDGFETQIGERGVRLSGGQKQRLAIARAFLKNAPVIILDEPTSALDAESERLIKEALSRLLRGRTALIIAHRLSTIENVDRIVVLDRGNIIEQGHHEELLERPGSLYRRFAEHQLTTNLFGMKNKLGFTLVEIMIDVAIIGLLAAIAIPNLLRTRMNANESAMKSELRTFSTANEAYRAAQNPMGYASTINDLITATPPYLDSSWGDPSKHGFDLSYAGGGASSSEYSLFADARPNEASTDYCVDQTGIVYSGGNGDDIGCTGGLAIP